MSTDPAIAAAQRADPVTGQQSMADRLGLTRRERMELAAIDQFAHTLNHRKETPMTTPGPAFEPWDELDQEAHDYLIRHASQRQNLVAHSLVERLNRQRVDLLAEATVVDAKVHEEGCCGAAVGSPAWLRDLADRLQQYLEDRFGAAAGAAREAGPRGIRAYADQVEKDERQAATDLCDQAARRPTVAEQRECCGAAVGSPAWLRDLSLGRPQTRSRRPTVGSPLVTTRTTELGGGGAGPTLADLRRFLAGTEDWADDTRVRFTRRDDQRDSYWRIELREETRRA